MKGVKAKVSLLTVFNYLAIFTAFTSGWVYQGASFFELRFSYFVALILFSYWLINRKKMGINKSFLLVFIALIAFSFYNVIIGNNTVMQASKQIIGIFINAALFYLIFKFNDFNVGKLFRIYLKLAFFVAAVGLFQEISYLLRFTPGYDYSSVIPGWRLATSFIGPFMRVNSIMREPTGLSVLLMPAFFCSVSRLLKINNMLLSRVESIIIIASVLLTFSATAIIGIVILVMLFLANFKNYKFIVVSALLFLVLLPLAYNSISDIMQYRDFERLLDLKFELQRRIHTEPPEYRPKLKRAVEALDSRLSQDPDNDGHLKEYGKRTRTIG